MAVVDISMVMTWAPWAPQGHPQDRLVMRVVLDAMGRLDQAAYARGPENWLAIRSCEGRMTRPWSIQHTEQGWVLRDPQGDDDPVWLVEGDLFRPGEVVQVHLPGDVTWQFRIVGVTSADKVIETERRSL